MKESCLTSAMLFAASALWGPAPWRSLSLWLKLFLQVIHLLPAASSCHRSSSETLLTFLVSQNSLESFSSFSLLRCVLICSKIFYQNFISWAAPAYSAAATLTQCKLMQRFAAECLLCCIWGNKSVFGRTESHQNYPKSDKRFKFVLSRFVSTLKKT